MDWIILYPFALMRQPFFFVRGKEVGEYYFCQLLKIYALWRM